MFTHSPRKFFQPPPAPATLHLRLHFLLPSSGICLSSFASFSALLTQLRPIHSSWPAVLTRSLSLFFPFFQASLAPVSPAVFTHRPWRHAGCSTSLGIPWLSLRDAGTYASIYTSISISWSSECAEACGPVQPSRRRVEVWSAFGQVTWTEMGASCWERDSHGFQGLSWVNRILCTQ